MLFREGFTKVFDNEDLVPSAWLAARGEGFRVFNPALLHRKDGSFAMAYRVVSEELGRKVACCALDARLNIIDGSVTPFSDYLQLDAGRFTPATCEWHADPRLFQLDGKDFLYWNDGYKKPHNNQFITAFDQAVLMPVGRPLLLSRTGPRQQTEKNWGLFFDAGLKALYTHHPYTVLSAVDHRDEEIIFSVTDNMRPETAASPLGELRGGAPPVLFAGEYYHFCHAVTHENKRLRHYDAAAFTVGADYREGVRRGATRPILLPFLDDLEPRFPRLNIRAGRIIYICGAVRLPEGWLISCGVNDERSALCFLTQEQVDHHMAPAG